MTMNKLRDTVAKNYISKLEHQLSKTAINTENQQNIVKDGKKN